MVMQKGMMMMATKTKSTSKTSSYLLTLPAEMMIGIKAIAEPRDQSTADFIRAAVRLKIMVEALGIDGRDALKLIARATEPLTQSANFAAVHSAGTLEFMREWAKDSFVRQGLPDDLAQEKAAALHETALAEALAAFEDPKIRHQFGWIEGPGHESNLPEWLTDDA